MLLMTLWRAWHIRNKIVHNKAPPPMKVSRRFLTSYLDSLIGIKSNLAADPSKGKSLMSYGAIRPLMDKSADPKWAAPSSGFVKLNTDGSFAEDGSAGAGMVLRDERGAIIFSSCRQLFHCRDALEAELCACMEDLSFSIQRSDLPVQVEMDSLMAVKLVQALDIDRSVFSSIIKEIRYLLSLHDFCITHVNRSQYKVSDSLAYFARSEGITMTWLSSGPPDALKLDAMDCKDLRF
ncbi:hypothetical protein VPH35_046956 [Triticum aestivum]